MDTKKTALAIIASSFLYSFYSPGFASAICLVVSILLYAFILYLERFTQNELKELTAKMKEIEAKVTAHMLSRLGR